MSALHGELILWAGRPDPTVWFSRSVAVTIEARSPFPSLSPLDQGALDRPIRVFSSAKSISSEAAR